MQETWPEGSFSETTAAHQDFAKFFAAASSPPREGYWSPFATLAWIVSRDDRFVAATQMFEEAYHSDQGALFSEISWMVLGNEANQRFGRNFSESCESDLRPALEQNRLQGGIARRLTSKSSEVIDRHQWADWQRSAEIEGLTLISGYVDFKWPSEAVQAAFPANLLNSSATDQKPGVAPIDPNAPPAINRDKKLADQCADIMRSKGGKLSPIMKGVIGAFDPKAHGNRGEDTVYSGIRRSFIYYYDKVGSPKN